jgi:hypothetical protein
MPAHLPTHLQPACTTSRITRLLASAFSAVRSSLAALRPLGLSLLLRAGVIRRLPRLGRPGSPPRCPAKTQNWLQHPGLDSGLPESNRAVRNPGFGAHNYPPRSPPKIWSRIQIFSLESGFPESSPIKIVPLFNPLKILIVIISESREAEFQESEKSRRLIRPPPNSKKYVGRSRQRRAGKERSGVYPTPEPAL